MSVSVVRWRGIPREAIAWREWDDELVVRNDRSGSTHLLGQLAGRVLEVLSDADAGMTVDAIANRLSVDAPAADIADWRVAIDAILSEFQRLGLAEPETR